MRISAIVAVDEHDVIGSEGRLPWHLPADLAWFKKHTLRKPVIMGRKTFASIGKALPNRTNIVLSRDPNAKFPDGIIVARDLATALSAAERAAADAGQLGDAAEIMIIGGGTIYAQALSQTTRIYRTRVKTAVAGDTFFPTLSPDEWIVVSTEDRPADEKNALACTFEILERRSSI